MTLLTKIQTLFFDLPLHDVETCCPPGIYLRLSRFPPISSAKLGYSSRSTSESMGWREAVLTFANQCQESCCVLYQPCEKRVRWSSYFLDLEAQFLVQPNCWNVAHLGVQKHHLSTRRWIINRDIPGLLPPFWPQSPASPRNGGVSLTPSPSPHHLVRHTDRLKCYAPLPGAPLACFLPARSERHTLDRSTTLRTTKTTFQTHAPCVQQITYGYSRIIQYRARTQQW